MIERTMSLVQPAIATMQLQSYTRGPTHTECTGGSLGHYATVDSVIAALQKLPDFSYNHPLLDELHHRQQGVVTKGDGYVCPKPDKAISPLDGKEVQQPLPRKNKGGKRTGKVPTDTSIGEVTTEGSSDPEIDTSPSTTK